MGLDRTRWPELMVGLSGIEVLEVGRGSDGRLHVAIETTDHEAVCAGCGTRAKPKDRDLVGHADLPAFGTPVTLVWRKRRWVCPEALCLVGSWTEDRPDIAPARAALTSRAGQWATREVGAEVHTVAYAAGQLGVTWHTAMDAAAYWGATLVDDPERVPPTEAVGVDETKHLAATRTEPTRWISAICDISRRVVVDVIEGRGGPELERWLAAQSSTWRDAVTATVTDLHEPFRKALARHLQNATAVADPFHVVGVANRVVDRTRRRVQQDTLGHRGRKADPSTGSASCSTSAPNASTTRARPACGASWPPATPTARSTRPGPPRSSSETSTPCTAPPPRLAAGSMASSRTAATPSAPRSGAWPAP